MRRLHLVVLAAALLLSAGMAGCGPSVPEEPPGIEGVATSVDRSAGEGQLTVLVEVPAGVDAVGFVSDKASVRVLPERLVFAPDGSEGDIGLIEEGVGIRVWFEGPVAESYPVQGTAGAVQVAP